jgi:thiol-disulfide isomerase/thioredoxin
MSIQKSTIIAGLAVAASLVVLGIGIAKARLHYIGSPKANASAHAATSASGVPSPADNSSVQSIRFVSNPQVAPPFLVNDITGNIISTAEWHGKVVVLNFWATWCPPCREEIPALIRLQSEYKDRLQIIGVSMDDAVDEKAVDLFVKQSGINYPVVMASPELIAEYGGVPALPTSFVVNPEGRVVQKHVGLHQPAEYEAEVRSLLALPVNAKVETFEDTGQIFLKNATLATELPDVDMKGLTKEQKLAALKRMNSETCTCGCGLTIAQCRINDTTCDISKHLASEIVKQVASGQVAPPAAPPPPPTSPSASD